MCRGCKANFVLPGRGAAPHTPPINNSRLANLPIGSLFPLWVFARRPSVLQLRAMDADIRLIVTDMDGTLLDGRRHLPAGFPDAVRTLAARGIRWAIASGRQLANLQARFAPLGVDVDIIAENGALAWAAGEARPFFEDLTPADFFEPVLREALDTPGASPVLCGADTALVHDRYPEDLAEITQYFAVHAPWHDLADLAGLRVCKVALYHPQAAQALHPRLAPLATAERRVILSGPEWVDVQHARIDKANALAALLLRLGLRPDQAIVFGDYLNDAGMLALTPHSVAMANALPELRARAAAIAPPNTQDGVLAHLRALGLL